MSGIRDLWIVNPDGITLFNASVEKGQALIGTFFSTIQTLVSQIGEKQMNSISLGDTKILCYQGRDGFLFILRFNKNLKTKNIFKKMKILETEFFNDYHNDLKDWDGQTDCFDRFEIKIQTIFKDTPFKFDYHPLQNK